MAKEKEAKPEEVKEPNPVVEEKQDLANYGEVRRKTIAERHKKDGSA